jgi:hypothetical protein
VRIRRLAVIATGFLFQMALVGVPARGENSGDSLSEALSSLAGSLEKDEHEKEVRRAFKAELDRSPSSSELRRYLTLMEDDHWMEEDVRDDLRDRSDYSRHSRKSVGDPEKVIRRAYQDILGRDPDSSGLTNYRNKILDQGWDEHDVREALRRSPEYRQKNLISRKDAEKIVRRAYLSVLKREPDPGGSTTYVDRVLSDQWTEENVARELRNSDEYRSKHR